MGFDEHLTPEGFRWVMVRWVAIMAGLVGLTTVVAAVVAAWMSR